MKKKMALMMARQIVKAVSKRSVFIIHFKNSYGNFVQGSVLQRTQGFTKVRKSILVDMSQRESLQKGFHSGSAFLKTAGDPPKDALVKVLDDDETTIGVMTFGQLENLARRKKKKVVNLSESKHTGKVRHVFQLASEKQDKERNFQGKTTQDSGKHQQLELKSRITDHDLGHKLKKVHDWIGKGDEVEILIIRKDENTRVIAELISKITEAVKETARVKHSKVNMDKYISCVIYLKPIVEQHQTSSDKLQPLKIDNMKRKQVE